MSFPDLRIAVRHLLKSPGFTATAVLMLAIGIGATTAVFSIVEAVLLRPLPFPQSERLVSLADFLQGANVGGNGEAGVTAPEIRTYTRDTHSFESLGGYQATGYELSGIGEPAQVNATRMTAGVFAALGVAPLTGRFFTQQEDDQSQLVAVVSYSLWQNRLHGDGHVLGTKILLDRKPYLVIGVMPRNFEFPLAPGHLNNSELWVPMSFTPEEIGPTGAAGWNFSMVGRLKPGITEAQAQQDAERVAQDINRNLPSFVASLHIDSSVKSLHEETIYRAQQLVRILFMAVAVVLLIACANLAGLLLVRAIRRRREIAMRMALGAGAWALLRQSVLESLVLSGTGGVLGLVLAALGLRFGMSRLPETMPRLDEITLDWQVVGFAIGLSLLTGVACGLAPAFAALRTNANETLKEGGRTGMAGGHSLLPQKQYPNQSASDEFNHELLRRLRPLPGVKYAGMTTFLPATGNNSNSTFVVEGYTPPKGGNMNLATPMLIEGDYLSAMGIPLLAGRWFTPSDTADVQLVGLVNHKFARHYWPGADPIGKRFRIGTPETPTPWVTIVGEVADVKENSPDVATKEQWYQPVEQFEKSVGALGSPADINGNGGFITIRTAIGPNQMANALRATVRSIDPLLPLTQVQSMESALSDSEAPRRFQTSVISAFAIGAVLLAALGIYSVVAFSAALRLQEMAIRMALGSQRSGILGLVFLSAIKLSLAGCALGLIAAAATSRLLDSLLFAVSPFDPLVLSLAAAFVIVLALTASLLPATRAASISPMSALRAD